MTYTIEEQKQHRVEWVKALRSGKYTQGHGCLTGFSGDGALNYCCLGVGYAVMGREPIDRVEIFETTAKPYADKPLFGVENGIEAVYYLPGVEMIEYFGLNSTTGLFKLPSDEEMKYSSDSLAAMNDRRLSFDQIADMIEYEPAGLFVEELTE
jgi:hypothetical protein